MTQPTEADAKLIDKTQNPQIGEQQTAIANPPAGGSGATAGAYDTAANRDLLIAKVTAILEALRSHGLIAD